MGIKYLSTRGNSPQLEFLDVLLAGLAPDGGLYLPATLPALPQHMQRNLTYVEVACEVIWPFVAGSLTRSELESILEVAYSTFSNAEICPIVSLDDQLHLLELFHGPTLAFKDLALQVVGRLFDHELARRQQRVTIVGATSGDTGSAAMEAVRGSEHVEIVVLYPYGRTSEVQRRQMTTLGAANVHAVAIQGTFDDCQDLVKAMFSNEAFRARHNLAAVNSINWARVMVQIVYYVWAHLQLGSRPTTFCVPTGNFGNIFAGHLAARMGLNVSRFLVASNSNDIITRVLATGQLEAKNVVPTISPSMDIQISSNLERLLFELLDSNGQATAKLMSEFRHSGRVELSKHQHARLVAEFAGMSIDDDTTLALIAEVHDQHAMLVDPHTAVGIGVAQRMRRAGENVVSLATAHPAKFGDAVEQATSIRPELPDQLVDIFQRQERYEVLPNELAVVCDYVDGLR